MTERVCDLCASGGYLVVRSHMLLCESCAREFDVRYPGGQP